MNPRVIGTDDHEVAILYHQRGVSPSGERLDAEVIGLYELRDFTLSRAQMFYCDEAVTAQFLSRAAAELRRAK
jgi:ketosteroid isomerase-like protein